MLIWSEKSHCTCWRENISRIRQTGICRESSHSCCCSNEKMKIEKEVLIPIVAFIALLVLLADICLEYKYSGLAEPGIWWLSSSFRFVQAQPESPVNDTGCDDECVRFRLLVHNESAWPNDKPRAVVVMLLGRRPKHSRYMGPLPGTTMFESFANCFDRYFNDHFRYPLVVYYEPIQYNDTDLRQLRAQTRSTVFFQPVNFTVPSFVNQSSSSLERCHVRSQGLGYKHMCRFHAKGIYEQPILQTGGLEYVWRLDDDSFLTRNVTYDLFRFMKERKLLYGHTGTFYDHKCFIVGLWKAASDFWYSMNVRRKFFWPEGRYYYNNFEISLVSLWRSFEYRKYVEHIDQLGGIYYHRWGDAPIKSIAVSHLLRPWEVHRFTNIGYRHNIHQMSN